MQVSSSDVEQKLRQELSEARASLEETSREARRNLAVSAVAGTVAIASIVAQLAGLRLGDEPAGERPKPVVFPASACSGVEVVYWNADGERERVVVTPESEADEAWYREFASRMSPELCACPVGGAPPR